MAGPFSIQYSLALIKVRDGADKERVGRRRLVRVYLGWGRLCPAVPVPAGEGAALAHAADHEQEEEDQGGDGGHQDVQPALRPQLGPAAGEAREEQHVVIPVSPAQVIPTMQWQCMFGGVLFKKEETTWPTCNPWGIWSPGRCSGSCRPRWGDSRSQTSSSAAPPPHPRCWRSPSQMTSASITSQLDSRAHLFWQWSTNNDFLRSVHGQTQFHGIPQIDQLCSLNEWSRV